MPPPPGLPAPGAVDERLRTQSSRAPAGRRAGWLRASRGRWHPRRAATTDGRDVGGPRQTAACEGGARRRREQASARSASGSAWARACGPLSRAAESSGWSAQAMQRRGSGARLWPCCTERRSASRERESCMQSETERQAGPHLLQIRLLRGRRKGERCRSACRQECAARQQA
jgi:hypothetical protein